MRRPWTSAEISLLRENASLGVRELASLLRRTESSVWHQASRFGVSLRRQPSLCPACGRFPIRDDKTGFCRPCSLRRLADRHRAELARIEAEAREREKQATVEAQRDLWQSRQQVHRARQAALS